MLKKKMLRDIKKNISQFITIFLMVLIGIFAYTGIEAYMLGMGDSAQSYYKKNNLQDLDVYGALKEEDVESIKKLNNVKDAEGKFTIMANVDSYKDHTAELNFIKSNNVARFHVMKGEKFSYDKDGLWVDSYYADKANIKVGDTLKLSYDDVKIEEKVLGLIMVPDHVYYTKDDAQIFSTHEDFGYVYLSEINLEDVIKAKVKKEMGITSDDLFNTYLPNFNYKDYLVYTSIMVDVNDEKDKMSVKEDIEKSINRASAVLDIKTEKSYSGYEREKEEGETYVGVFSGLFIFIALLSVITTMTRVVRAQRTEIGTLKALGYSTRRVSFHYLSYAIFLSLMGSIFGLIIGYYGLGKFFLDLEMDFYAVPDYKPGMAPSAYLVALITVLLTAGASYLATRKVLKESAADTLRPERPKVSNEGLKITNKLKFLNFSSRWNIRDIFRNKARTLMGLIGIAGCSGLFVAGFGMYDSIGEYLRIELDEINNYDYRFNLNENITDTELNDLENKYGNHTSKSLGIEIKKDGKIKANNIFIDDSKGYMKVLDEDFKEMKMKNNGVYITRKLASLEGYSIGDTIKWHIYGDSKYYESKIVGFNRDPQNQNMSMTRSYYESLGLKYRPDSLYSNEKIDVNKSYAGVSVVQEIDSIKEGFNNMIEAMLSMIYIIIFFAAVLGAVIIYNMGILSFTEKDYQFATLKVLGFDNKKIGKIFMKQNIWITIAAIIIGLPFGYLIVDFMFKYAIGDVYDFVSYVSLRTYIMAAVGTFVVSVITSYILVHKIKKIDMVKSLKASD